MNSDKNSFLFSKISLSQIGALGHSYGGATSYQTAYQDERVRAAIDIDGTIFNFEDKVLTKPFAFYVAQDTKNFQLFDSDQAFNNTQGDTYKVIFNGFFHGTFGGGDLFWQWDYPDFVVGHGTISAIRANELISSTVRQFFDKYLKDASAPWLDKNESTPKELEVEKIN